MISVLLHFSILFFGFVAGSAIATWWNRPPRPPKQKAPQIVNQHDWMEDFNLWMLQCRSKASPSNTAVGAYRLSGSALSSANRLDQIR